MPRSFLWAISVASALSQIVPPNITSNGVTYIGITNSKGLSAYKSIPFAQPPIGPLRFQPPQPLNLTEGTIINASAYGPTCHKDSADQTGMSEDCLTLQVLTPANLTSTSKLPVIVYVFGGSFTSGSVGSYDATNLLVLGNQQKTPAIFITMSYRLGGYGFLVGEEARAAGYDNVGLLDQRAALEWVQANIAAFGGDPTRVTFTGQSSGAVSVALHMLRGGGQTFGLYSAASMWSGAAVTVGIGQPIARQQIFTNLLNITGCTDAPAVFDCLGALNESDYHIAAYNASQGLPSYMWAPQIDGVNIPGPPSALIKAGKFAAVPFISGSVLDDGAQFIANKVFNTTDDVKAGVTARFPANTFDNGKLDTLLTMYSPLPADGSPFSTGNETFGIGPLGKLANAVLGDVMFQAARHFLLYTAGKQKKRPCWSYLFIGDGPNVANGRTGIAHGADIGFWYARTQKTTQQQNLAKAMGIYWLNFAKTGSPNAAGSIDWPEYSSKYKMQQFSTQKITTITDNARAAPISYINQNPTAFFH